MVIVFGRARARKEFVSPIVGSILCFPCALCVFARAIIWFAAARFRVTICGPHMKILSRISILSLFLVVLFACDRGDAPLVSLEEVYPWQIVVLPDGRSRVFGITLGGSRLADAVAILGQDFRLALFENKGESLTLEAYYKEVTRGGLSGRMVLVLEAEQPELEAMRERAVKRRVLDSGAVRYTLTSQDYRAALEKTIYGLNYIPYIHLDEDIVRRRFGEPAERIVIDPARQHWLYPDRGLDLLLDEEGKELLQYVAPAEFGRLRAPLLQQQAAS